MGQWLFQLGSPLRFGAELLGWTSSSVLPPFQEESCLATRKS